MLLRIAAALLALTPSILVAQAASSEPLVVDVHASPYRASINVTVNLSRQRFDMRNATIVNMIDFMLGRPDDDGREDDAIVGGPTWIDLERFDVSAVIPTLKSAHGSGDAYAQVRPFIKQMLAERFHLTYHAGDRPLPGFIATVAKDGPKLAQAKDPEGSNGCKGLEDKADTEHTVIVCTSETVAQLLAAFSDTFPHPVIDQTDLKKPYDFTMRLSTEELQSRAGYIHALIEAYGKLGIIVARGDVPQPAIVVDTVDRPTANPEGIAKLIPALPDLEFEVASIRPAGPNEPQNETRVTGSQIAFTNYAMQELLRQAWQLPTGAMLGNAPAWLSQTRYTILVKLPPEVDARAVVEDQDQIANMLQKLLVERFQIKYHWGEQVQEGWMLLAGGTPKMKKADPNSRSFCKYGPPEGEKDVRRDSPFDGEFHCQNVTMAQFADLVQAMAKSDIKNRVPNKTGLEGAYDFTFYYTSGHRLRLDAQTAAKQGGDAASAPVMGMSIEDAFRKQLGLRLQRQSGTFPALVLDHIEQTPTEN